MDTVGTVAATPRTSEAPAGRGAVGVAGIAGFVYFASLFVTPPDGPSMATATAQQVRDHVSAHGSAIQAGAFAGMIGVAAALVFFAALTRQVRDRLPASMLADLVLASGVTVVIYQWLLTTTEAMTTLLPNLIESDLPSVDDSTLRGWFALTGFTHFLGDLAVVPIIIAMASFSMAALRGRLLPRWLSWSGLAVSASGALGVVGVLAVVDTLYPFWFVALFGYVLWVAALATTFLIRVRHHQTQTPSTGGAGTRP